MSVRFQYGICPCNNKIFTVWVVRYPNEAPFLTVNFVRQELFSVNYVLLCLCFDTDVVSRFFLCFSLIQNTSRIMDTNVPASAITSINGMRVLSMWWVILGHTYSIQMLTSISKYIWRDLRVCFLIIAITYAIMTVAIIIPMGHSLHLVLNYFFFTLL